MGWEEENEESREGDGERMMLPYACSHPVYLPITSPEDYDLLFFCTANFYAKCIQQVRGKKPEVFMSEKKHQINK